jgi:hypothetical protein
VPILSGFSTPGNVADPDPEAWSGGVSEIFSRAMNGFPQFYDPTATDTPAEAMIAPVVWPAFPGSLRGSAQERLEIADRERGAQDEYCEWALEKNEGGTITRITFTTEVPEYFDHLFATDPDGLLALYQNLIGPQVEAADLEQNGAYLRANKWNNSTEGRPAHLNQISNNLEAAVQLAATATILRKRNGKPVTGKQELVDCGKLGEPLRNSDPQIASAVNNAAASGAEITLNDPVGLYIDGLITGGMATPDGEDPAAFWKIERGDAKHALRASYEVPESEERGYAVGDITIDGRPIGHGGELAVRVRVRLDAVIKPGSHQPSRQPCEN